MERILPIPFTPSSNTEKTQKASSDDAIDDFVKCLKRTIWQSYAMTKIVSSPKPTPILQNIPLPAKQHPAVTTTASGSGVASCQPDANSNSQKAEKEILIRLLKCCDFKVSPLKRLNLFWKVILQEFRDYVCFDASSKLEKLIGPNNFYDQKGCDMNKQDSPCVEKLTNLVELFQS